MKRILCCVLLCLMALGTISAQENEIDGKTIDRIEFEGIVHADSESLKAVTDKYVGKPFSDEMLNSLQAELYALQYFSYFYAYADRTGENNENIVLTFRVTELPYVTKVDFVGNDYYTDDDLLDMIKTKENSFLSNTALSNDKHAIQEAYVDKGYINSSVESEISKNEEDNSVSIIFTISEGKQSKIDQILFEGNDTYSSSSLKRVLTSKEQSLFHKGEYAEANILLDKKAILQYYSERGFIDAKITDVKLSVDSSDPTKDMISLTFVIDEGEQWKFGGIETIGNTIFDDETIQREITQRIGEPINMAKLQKDIASIADLYWNEGYIYNDIVPEESRNERDHTVSYVLHITEKKQAYIEDIIIKGNEKTKDYVLYRELTVSVGDVFSKEAFITSVQNLYNTGIISNVDYNVLFGSEDGLVVLEFIVEESNKVDLQFGATFGGTDDFPVSGFLSWTDKNFGGRGQDFSVALNVASASQNLDFSFAEPWLAHRRWNGGFSFSISHNKYDSILQDQSGVIFTDDDYYNGIAAPDPYNSYEEYQNAVENNIEIPEEFLMDYEQYKFALGFNTGYTFHTGIGRFGVNGGLNIALSDVIYDDGLYTPYNPLIRNNLNNWKFSNKLNMSANWDGRDLVENTTRGFLFEENITYAGGLLGGTRSYIKNSFGASGYLTLLSIPSASDKPRNIVLSARSTVSTVFPQFFSYEEGFGLAEQPIATQSEKLYIDGMNIVRGIESPIHNLEFLWDSTVDITVPIAQNVISGEVFFSATGYKSNYEDITSLTARDFYFSTGAGVKLTIPGFPIGLYATKVFSINDDNTINWQPGDIFVNPDNPNSGLNLVFAITYSLYQ